jgi:hypothetical protein
MSPSYLAQQFHIRRELKDIISCSNLDWLLNKIGIRSALRVAVATSESAKYLKHLRTTGNAGATIARTDDVEVQADRANTRRPRKAGEAYAGVNRAVQENLLDPAAAGLVEVWGFEPQTFSLRTRRSTS